MAQSMDKQKISIILSYFSPRQWQLFWMTSPFSSVWPLNAGKLVSVLGSPVFSSTLCPQDSSSASMVAIITCMPVTYKCIIIAQTFPLNLRCKYSSAYWTSQAKRLKSKMHKRAFVSFQWDRLLLFSLSMCECTSPKALWSQNFLLHIPFTVQYYAWWSYLPWKISPIYLLLSILTTTNVHLHLHQNSYCLSHSCL